MAKTTVNSSGTPAAARAGLKFTPPKGLIFGAPTGGKAKGSRKRRYVALGIGAAFVAAAAALTYYYWPKKPAFEGLDPASPEGILVKQAPPLVYDLLTRTPEAKFKALTDKNPGGAMPVEDIRIPAAKTDLSVRTVRADEYSSWKGLRSKEHASDEHCYYTLVVPQPWDGSYNLAEPLSNMGTYNTILCFDGSKPYFYEGEKKTFTPLSDKDGFLAHYNGFNALVWDNIKGEKAVKPAPKPAAPPSAPKP